MPVLNSAADRAKAVMADIDRGDFNSVSIGDIEQIALTMADKWDAMSLLRAAGAAYFATGKGVTSKARESAFKDLRLRLYQFLVP
jgi:hypothetical protein